MFWLRWSNSSFKFWSKFLCSRLRMLFLVCIRFAISKGVCSMCLILSTCILIACLFCAIFNCVIKVFNSSSNFSGVSVILLILIMLSSVFLNSGQFVFLYVYDVLCVLVVMLCSIVVVTGRWSEFNSFRVTALVTLFRFFTRK